MRPSIRNLADRRGVAALEFALIAPVLVVIVMSLYDVTNAVITWWRLATAADAIALIATNYAAAADGTNSLSFTQATTASTAVFAVMPALAPASASGYGVAISSVVMTSTVPGCSHRCSYSAATAWSAVFQGTAARRPCGKLATMADGAPSIPGALPADAFSPAPILVVDVTYDFVPLFTTLFGSGLQFTQSAYMAARTGTDADWVRLTGAGAALAARCPGYS